ncbi:hypothetical protein [Nioella nitratireducens]|uniref:hypothetical protein n=1 Tax=Nioella nitratireducens TaxID=1287720 RepID=UPI0011BAAA61|nr:hypothetical protein [Nioella nitratireducens]
MMTKRTAQLGGRESVSPAEWGTAAFLASHISASGSSIATFNIASARGTMENGNCVRNGV